MLFQNLTLTPEAKIEATMQHEITRLTSENLVSLISVGVNKDLHYKTITNKIKSLNLKNNFFLIITLNL